MVRVVPVLGIKLDCGNQMGDLGLEFWFGRLLRRGWAGDWGRCLDRRMEEVAVKVNVPVKRKPISLGVF